MEEKFNFQDYAKKLIGLYIREVQGDKHIDSRDEIYNRSLEEIEKKKNGFPNEYNYERIDNFLGKLYDLFKDEQVVQRIRSEKINTETFIRRYKEELFGDDKRRYNMSALFNEDLISSKYGNRENKMVRFRPQDGVKNTYKTENGLEITIQETGRLYYIYNYVVEKNLGRYKITVKSSTGEIEEITVFSNILIYRMDNLEYRNAVIGELLSKRNISLSNSGGYIGQISEIDESTAEIKVGEERESTINYVYRINNHYILEYDAADLSAVMIYIRQKEDPKNPNPSTHEEEEK